MPDSALKSRSQEWNFGGSRTYGAQVFPAPKINRTASPHQKPPYWPTGKRPANCQKEAGPSLNFPRGNTPGRHGKLAANIRVATGVTWS
jgi:hypothetical protein